jgi:L-alanine-DL-glutamate epimerase-like enolase superfamily enzyme
VGGRIADVRLTPVSAPRAGIVCGHVIVELTSDDGVEAIGEMSDFQHLPMYHVDVAELERTLRELLIGRDARDANTLARMLDEAFPSSDALYDKSGVIRCGVDVALWDLRAKLLGANVTDLLGGRVRDMLPIAYPIFRQQSAADISTNLDVVRRMVARGFHRFRLYVGRNADLDREFMHRACDEFGDAIAIKSLDFSNLLDAREAARFIESTRDIPYEFVEAPARVGDHEGLRFIRERTLVPVSEHAASPRMALQLASSGAVDILNVGLFVLGGITPALRVLSIAQAAGLRVVIGTTQELSIGTAAGALVGVSTSAEVLASDPVGPLLYQRDVVATPLEFRESALIPPTGPGLGMTISPERLLQAAEPLRWGAVETTSVVDRTGSLAR